jgi:uncharacterized cofD-like protein
VNVPTPTALELEMAALESEFKGPNVVAIGGGHGLASALTAIRDYATTTTAIVSVADDGGSSGRLIDQLGIPAPGDIRRCLLALTPDVSVWSELFSYRFEAEPGADTDVSGHSLGNLIIAALTDLADDFAAAVNWAGTLLGTMGEVIPAADRIAQLAAVVDGTLVEGQANIGQASGPITKVVVGPEGVTAHPHALEAIAMADQIVLAPGSLFTSVIAALAVPGVADAVHDAPGELAVVMNMVTEDADTLGMSGHDHLLALADVGGLERRGTVIMHRGPTKHSPPLEAVTVAADWAHDHGWNLVDADLGDDDAPRAMHDPAKLRTALQSLL